LPTGADTPGEPTTYHLDDDCPQGLWRPNELDLDVFSDVHHDLEYLDVIYREGGNWLMATRIRWFGLAMILCFCGLLVQLDNIQGLKAKQYQSAARNPITVENEYAKPRGTIESSEGTILATSVPTPNNSFYKYQREYPTGSLFSQVVGFTSYTYGGVGGAVNGVEAEYNTQLTYHTQQPRTLGDLLTTQQGTDTVVLTISDKFQALARQALGNLDGAVVMLNPSNGNVLAMYSNPSFDPNPLASQDPTTESSYWTHVYNATDSHGYTNGLPLTYDDSFAPGSTFKVITTATAYDHSPGLTTQFFPYSSTYKPPGTNLDVHNDSGGSCGGTVQIMLPQSCDTGYAHMGIELGAPNLTTEAASFGFFARPPIDLPTEPGSVSTMCSGVTNCDTSGQAALNLEGDLPFLAYSAIGQGNVVATPLEMAMVASGIADDGVIMTPHVMQRILDPKDNVIDNYSPTQWIRATSAKTAQSVSSLMQGVVSNPQGTAYGIFRPAWQVAAKTGTAQSGKGNSATVDWMIAFAPASHPVVALAVVVPKQALNATGAIVSGPIVRTMLSGICNDAGCQ
jgi:peptidoglycan glycosyltransferase